MSVTIQSKVGLFAVCFMVQTGQHSAAAIHLSVCHLLSQSDLGQPSASDMAPDSSYSGLRRPMMSLCYMMWM